MSTEPATPPRTRWIVALNSGIVLAFLAGLLVAAFLWPITTLAPRDVRIGVVGPAEVVSALQQGLAAYGDAVTVVPAGSRDEAVAQIRSRDTIGAVVITDPVAAREILTAPAAGAATTQIMTTLAENTRPPLGPQATAADAVATQPVITPVVPLANTDPTGAGISAAGFPLTLAGLLGGVLISLLIIGPVRRLAALALFAVLGGYVLAVVLRTWFGFVPGDSAGLGPAMSLSILATSAFVVGCGALMGRAGIAVGAIVTMLIANPLSAAAVPWQFIAPPWGLIGQYMVPGASSQLIRDLGYFPDANMIAPWLTLVGWVLLGVAMIGLGQFRSQIPLRAAKQELETAPA